MLVRNFSLNPVALRRCAMRVNIMSGVFSLSLLSGCALGPDFQTPSAPKVDRYTQEAMPGSTVAAGGVSQHFSSSADLPADWWKMFGSAGLDNLVARALKHNPGLQASEATLRQSQDSVKAAYGVYFPQVDLNGQGRRQRTAPLEQGSDNPSTVFNFVSLGGSISYVLDIFGGERRMVEGARAASENQEYLTRAAYLMLSANVVNTAIARAAYAEQIRLTTTLIALQTQQLQLTQAQYRAGTLAYASVLSVQNQLASYQAILTPLQLKQDQASHLLASLSGLTPAEAQLPDLQLQEIKLPSELPLSLPSSLVRQRPDILSSETQMHIASANVGVATAALFPGISLNATFGQAAANWGNLSGANQKFWSVGPSIDLPLLKGNNPWYERKAALDALQTAQASYRQTVLTAFAQVADTLKAIEYDAVFLQSRTDALQAATEALRLLKINEQSGIAGYGDVLQADILKHLAEIDYLQAMTQRCQDSVSLFVALGGGWWNAPANDVHEDNS